MKSFTQFIKQKFDEIADLLPKDNGHVIQELRQKSLLAFEKSGLPSSKNEMWKHSPIEKMISDQYEIQTTPSPYRPVNEYFKCKIHNIDTYMFTFLNGWYVHQNAPLTIFPDGTIVGSLFAAIQQFPDLVFPHLSQHQFSKTDSLVDLNEAFFNDGIFIYVPDNVSVSKPMQIVSLVDSTQNLMIQNHNLIILGKNASLSLVQCDDSIRFGKTLINNVTEFNIGEQAKIAYYKTENKDIDSLLINHVFVNQDSHSQFFSNTITFNAGFIKNMIHVNLKAPFAEAKLYGLYLVDKKQFSDNQVFINHLSPNCTSYQMYKGIADDEARANFSGHIIVQPHAQRTTAYQSNKNITLTDQAKIATQPFLEIYADDVRCSHGATIGQLDDEALFYLRSRGICQRNARMLLMYAFANEIINFVDIETLKEQLLDMVKKRLSGELQLCDQCVLHCSEEHDFNFEIDITKI